VLVRLALNIRSSMSSCREGSGSGAPQAVCVPRKKGDVRRKSSIVCRVYIVM